MVAVRTDVSKRADVEAPARQTLDTFRAVHLFFNNAGVGAGGERYGTPRGMIRSGSVRCDQEEQFYLLPEPQWTEVIQVRTDNLLALQNPPSRAEAVADCFAPDAGRRKPAHA